MTDAVGEREDYEARVQELLDRFPTEDNVGALQRLLETGGVPDAQRAAVWRYFLGCSADGGTAAAAAAALPRSAATSPVLPGELARLRADCAACALLTDARSRLRDRPAEARARLERVVLCLRTRGGVGAYARWMCAAVAPFVCLGLGETECLACAGALLRCVAPHVLCADAAGAGGALAELLRLLVYYADPALGLHLEQRGAGPALAAAAREWLASLLAGACAGLAAVHALWDAVLVARDARRPLALALALLVRRSAALRAAATDTALRAALREATRVADAEDARALLADAAALGALLPRSLWKQVRGVVRCGDVAHGGVTRAWVAANIAGAVCLHVSARDVLREQRAGVPVFFVDARPAAAAAACGTLPTALALPLAALLDDAHPARGRVARLPPAHRVVLFGTGAGGDDSADLAALAVTLLRRGVAHLAVVHNGYRSIHALAAAGETELVNHHRDTCPLCTPPAPPASAARAALSSLLARATAAVRSTPSLDSGVESLRLRAASAGRQQQQKQQKQRAAPATPQPVVSTLQDTEPPAAAPSPADAPATTVDSPKTPPPVAAPLSPTAAATATLSSSSPALSETPTTSPATDKLRTAPLAELPVASSSDGVFTIEDDDDDEDDA